MTSPEPVDAVVIGANIRGLVTTYMLSTLGYRAVLIERGPNIGGADSSFVTPGGARFDNGMHVLDKARSPLTTRLFTHVVGGRVHETTLRRGIVLRGNIMPYAPEPRDMPESIRSLLGPQPIVDAIGDALPTRARLSQHYGAAFADMIFDEVLPSYPTENRHRTFGVDESRLLTNIYPWFFPRAERQAVAEESRAFHDKLRCGVEQRVLYPESGGFGGFAQGFVDRFNEDRIEVVRNAGPVHLELEPDSHTVRWAEAGGRRFSADRYFWAAAWPGLCSVLEVPCQDVITDQVLLGSFRLNRPVLSDYNEILVGDPSLHINRIYLPATFRRSDEALVQVEFAAPVHEDRWGGDASHWQKTWTDALRTLGLIDPSHRVEEFDFRRVRLHFNAFGAEGQPLVDADQALIRRDSNLHPVVPSMANLNLNRYVPRVVRDVSAALQSAN